MLHLQSAPLAVPAHRERGPSSEFHQWPLPAYVWPALERLYHSIFCSEPHLRVHQTLSAQIEAWTERCDGRIDSLWLFEREGRRARVLLEVCELNAHQVQAFAQAVFERYRTINLIEFKAVHLVGSIEKLPVQKVNFSEDYVLDLPASAEQWYAALSPRSREKTRYYLRRARRLAPNLQFHRLAGSQITQPLLEKILQMNRSRMRAKGRSFGIDDTEQARLYELMRERGQISWIEIDGNIIAGLLCTLSGPDIFMHVVAHDSTYDDLRPGQIVCTLAIEQAIQQGLQRFHFLWGHYEYKQRLGATAKPLHNAIVWRSRWRALAHLGRLAALLQAGLRSQWRTRRRATVEDV